MNPRTELLLLRAVELMSNYLDMHTDWCSKFEPNDNGTCRCGGGDRLIDEIRAHIAGEDEAP